jgi:hypothetical protein
MTRLRRSLLSLAALLIATSAFAVTQEVHLTATVATSCTISDSTAPTAVTQSLSIDATGRVSTSPVTLTFPFQCNNAANLEVATANRGLSGPAAVSGYESKIHYTAATSGVFPAVTYNTKVIAPDLPGGGSSYVSGTNAAAQGTLTLTITPTAHTNPLAPGIYTDTVRLIITPTQ